MRLLIILFNILLLGEATRDDSGLRIANGHETFERFLVELFIKVPNEHVTCSGSIINRHWVITSGHCFDEGPLLFVKIDRVPGPPRILSVERIVIHPKYHHNKNSRSLDYVRYDLALLKTKEAMDTDGFLGPIDLDISPPVPGAVGTVSGYGLPDLEAREGEIVLSYCNGLLCTHSVGDETRPEQGDSGGPLVVNGRLIGVDSTSVQLRIRDNFYITKTLYTEYFADIASNYKWIESVIHPWPYGMSRTA
ncbi:trypsin-2-like [Choristoneura fumiferana]|uniref:trypsin-2-like n=1 Tax=Choristoneura fumiferana TaxID=7141 RepID=UPI003D157572